MSEDQKETGKASDKPAKAAKGKAAKDAESAAESKAEAPAAAEKPAAPAAKAAEAKPAPAAAAKTDEPPPPPEPGVIGQQLQKAKITFTPLGDDSAGVEMISVEGQHLLAVGDFLQKQAGFDLLLSCAGIDWKTHRESVYHFYGTKTHRYLAVKVQADPQDHSPSLTPLWSAADWHERESYDLVGIHYDGHPNLTRILMPNDWLGHPLRKDYKVDDPRLVWNER